MEDDFINIETTKFYGKSIIKFDHTYIDSLNGNCIDIDIDIDIEYTSDSESSYQLSDTESISTRDTNNDDHNNTLNNHNNVANNVANNNHNSVVNNVVNNNQNNAVNNYNSLYVQQRKPEMVVAPDNKMIIDIKNYILENKSVYCLNISVIPILISDINHLFLNDLPIELIFDYTQHILTWMNHSFYDKLYNKDRINVTNAVYRHIITEYQSLKISPILPYNEKNVYREKPEDIDTFIEYFLKSDHMYFIHNVFELIVALMKKVSKFNLNIFQKKIYVMHVVKLLSNRDIFPNELECLIMKNSTYLYSAFIDVILIRNKMIIERYEEQAVSKCYCMNIIRNLFCMPKYY